MTRDAGACADRDACLALPDEKLIAQCNVETYRASGPGGQHRNKRDSAVRLTHRPTGVVATATERRSQHENRRRALARLRKAIAMEVRAGVGFSRGDRKVAVAERYGGLPPAARTSPPAGALAKVLADPAWPRVSRMSEAYLVAAAQVLDRLEAAGGSVSGAAAGLGATTASLVKFLSLDSDLWQAAGRIRSARGLKALRMP